MKVKMVGSPRRIGRGTVSRLRLAVVVAVVVAVVAIAAGGCGRPGVTARDSGADRGRLRLAWAGKVAPEQLNVVLITLDTVRADRLSCYGSSVQTPHLDRLAREGVRFTQASSTVPFTFPAHSSILTGTYPPFHGVRENVGYYLGEGTPTLAERLRSAGVETAGFVSSFVLDSRWGIGRGFDHYFDDFDLAAFEDANLGSVQRPGSETLGAVRAWLAERQADGERSARPLFLWVHLYDAHDPYTPPEPYRSRYPGRPYDGEVAYVDSLVGELRAALEVHQLFERSLVVVTADHGEGLGDHGEAFHGYFVYDSTVHVPLIVRAPGLREVTEVTVPVSHVDLVPTILDLTGRPLPSGVQGRSLLGEIAGESAAAGDDPQAGAYSETFYPLYHYGWAPLRALRTATFKYIEAPTAELYDLTVDPGERDNLFAGRPEVGRPLARTLRGLADRLAEGAASSTVPDLDEQELAQLRALGYLAGRGEAASDYDPAVARADPKDKVGLHRLIMKAQSQVSAGDEAAAAASLTEALAADPGLLDAHQLLGNVALHAGDLTDAERHFERALALDDRNKPSLFGLASARLRQGRADEALVGFERLLRVAGQDSKATLAIADIQVERGNLEAAKVTLQAAALPGAVAMLSNRLGEVQALLGETAAAKRSFEQALRDNERLSQPHFNLAVLAEEVGDLERARVEYQLAIDKAPRHAEALFNLARLFARLGDPKGELDMLERAVAAKSDHGRSRFFLAKALMDRGADLGRAEELTRAGLALDDQDPLGWFVLADLLNRRGQAAEAGTALQRGEKLAASGH